MADYAFVSFRKIPDTMIRKAALFKCLELARKGTGSTGVKGSARTEYAVDFEVVRRKLSIEGKLMRVGSKKKQSSLDEVAFRISEKCLFWSFARLEMNAISTSSVIVIG